MKLFKQQLFWDVLGVVIAIFFLLQILFSYEQVIEVRQMGSTKGNVFTILLYHVDQKVGKEGVIVIGVFLLIFFLWGTIKEIRKRLKS